MLNHLKKSNVNELKTYLITMQNSMYSQLELR